MLSEAGISGRLWLAADSALNFDLFRIRLGPVVGNLSQLSDFGIGQGKRAAVHLFGVLVKSLADEVAQVAWGVGLDIPRGVARAFSQCTAAGDEEEPNVPHLSLKAQTLASIASAHDGETDLLATFQNCALQERLSIIDIWASNSLLIVQFVDDAFLLQSSLAGLRTCNVALQKFASQWNNKFKGGAKRASVLATGVASLVTSSLGDIQGEPVRPVSRMQVLGST